MRNWAIVIVVIALVSSIITGGLLYARLSNEIGNAKADIAKLEVGGGSLQAGNLPATTTSATSGATVMTMIDLISMVQPTIVRIDVTGSNFVASGSGVVIRSDGYVMTNEHVVDSATSITVTMSDDRQYPAAVTSSDANLDLAIIKLTRSPANLATAVLGSASDVVIGGVVVAAGFPLGRDLPGPASFTQGIVSAIRTIGGQRYIQSDVVINPGNSGGALVARTSGKVIGITSAGLVLRGQNIEGIGLAIPIDVVQDYIQTNLK